MTASAGPRGLGGPQQRQMGRVFCAPQTPRVLLLADSLAVGGIASAVVSLASGLQARGVDVHVAHLGLRPPSSFAGELAGRSIPVLDLQVGRLYDPRPTIRLARYLTA